MPAPDPMPRQAGRRVVLPRWSVRGRILTSILIVTALGMTVAGATAYAVQRERTLTEVDQRLLSRVESARFVVTGQGSGGGDTRTSSTASPEAISYTTTDEAVRGIIQRVTPRVNESSLGLVGGVPAYVPDFPLDFHLEDDPALLSRIAADTADGSVWRGTAVSPIGRLRYVAIPIGVEGDSAAGLYITAIDIDRELDPLNDTFRTFAIVALGALVAVGLVGSVVAGRLLRPIRDLRATASRITLTALDERIPVLGRDDVSDLTETVNGMLDRLEASITAQQQLLDDVRHELKTPLTIVRGHLELLDPADAEDVAQTRMLAIDELDRMNSLVDDIGMLAENAGMSAALESVDVAELTDEVFAKVRALAGHDWQLDGRADGHADMDPARITQAWLQLADNAAKYSDVDTRITIGSRWAGDSVELWVADRGPGVPADAQERIFERFGRADPGRGIQGAGLGLAIVSAIAAAHDGHVDLTTSDAGSRFAIVLPRARTTSTIPSKEKQ